MALDLLNRGLFLECRNRVMAVVNADSGKAVANYRIGDHVDASAFDPAAKLVFHSTGDGNVAIFREDSPNRYTFLENVATIVGSKTMALDTKTHRRFVPVAGRRFIRSNSGSGGCARVLTRQPRNTAHVLHSALSRSGVDTSNSLK
jgi:hypothetical protein